MRVLLSLFLSITLSSTAIAATMEASDVLPDPVRSPVAAWLVGPSSANPNDMLAQTQCMMVNEFDNGFLIGLHTKKSGIIGMSVDTKQPAFQAGQTIPAALILGADSISVPTKASDETTVMMDLSFIHDLRDRLPLLGAFAVKLADKTLYLSTVGIDDGLTRMGNCLGEQETQAMPVAKDVRGTSAPLMQEVTTRGQNEPLALAMASIVPSGYRFDLRDGINPMTPISWQEGSSWRETLAMALTPIGYTVDVDDRLIIIGTQSGTDVRLDKFEDKETLEPTQPVWTALQGARLRDVLRQWGQQAGIKVAIDLDGEYLLDEDIAYEGELSQAVAKLMDKMAALDPDLRADFSHPLTTGAVAADNSVDNAVQNAPITAAQWRALEGASLQDVLTQWSVRGGVQVRWSPDQTFALSKTINMQGSYTDAVIAVLQQFDGQNLRPVAQLNTDPDTGERILLIRTSGDNS